MFRILNKKGVVFLKKLIEPKKDTAKKYGYSIAEILNNKDCPFTLTTLAEKVEISAGGMSNLINGVNTPSIDTMENIAKTLNVSIDFLLGNTNNPTLNRDLDIVYDYTGLSEKAILNIKKIMSKKQKIAERFLPSLNGTKENTLTRKDIVNALLESSTFEDVIDEFIEYTNCEIVCANLDYNNNSKVKSSNMNSENEISPKSKAIYDGMSKKKTNDSFMHLFKIQEMLKDYIKQFSKAITKDGVKNGNNK